MEITGRQFLWTVRYPGGDAEFGATDPSLVTIDNPIGLVEADPRAAGPQLSESQSSSVFHGAWPARCAWSLRRQQSLLDDRLEKGVGHDPMPARVWMNRLPEERLVRGVGGLGEGPHLQIGDACIPHRRG